MGPILPSKSMATGVAILVLFNLVTSTLAAAALTNSTEIASPKAGHCCHFKGLCLGLLVGLGCQSIYNDDECCCEMQKECKIGVKVTLEVGRCYPDYYLSLLEVLLSVRKTKNDSLSGIDAE